MPVDPGTTLRGTRWRHRLSGAEGQVLSVSMEMRSDWPAPDKKVVLTATIDPKREGTPFTIRPGRSELVRCCELQGSTDGYAGGPCPVHGGPTYVQGPYTADELVLTQPELEADWEPIGPHVAVTRGPMPRPELQAARAELRMALLSADPVTLAALRHELWKLDRLNRYQGYGAPGWREDVERTIQAITLALFPLEKP